MQEVKDPTAVKLVFEMEFATFFTMLGEHRSRAVDEIHKKIDFPHRDTNQRSCLRPVRHGECVRNN